MSQPSEEKKVRSLRPRRRVDEARVADAFRSVLEAIGEDPDRDGLQGTPERVARMYAEVFAGLQQDPVEELNVLFEAGHDEMIMIRDVPLYSMCEHHLIPFVGVAHVAYVPNVRGQITGLSKLARVVEVLARRPQVQERLTTQIADAIEEALDPRGVLVVLEAEHLCMTMRGIQKPGSQTVTSAVRGLFRENEATRAEAMNLISHS